MAKEQVNKKDKKTEKTCEIPKPRSKYAPGKYNATMPDKLVECLAKGGSRADFCAMVNLSYKMFDLWREKYPEFQQAYEVGLPKSEAKWQSIAKDHIVHTISGEQLNSVAWSMNMRNRFGWTEHRTIMIPGLDKAEGFQEKYELLCDLMSQGKLTGTEITAVSNMLQTGLKISESVELLERIDKLEQLLEQKQQDEAVGTSKNGKA